MSAICGWHGVYFPAEGPPILQENIEMEGGDTSHGICLKCLVQLFRGEGGMPDEKVEEVLRQSGIDAEEISRLLADQEPPDTS
jgi:hypothetical protein